MTEAERGCNAAGPAGQSILGIHWVVGLGLRETKRYAQRARVEGRTRLSDAVLAKQ